MSVTVVVGAAKGIGRAVALRAGQSSGHIAILDISAEGLDDVASRIGRQVSTHVVDIRDSDAVLAIVAGIEDSYGPITALAHVAGILDTGSVLDSDAADWRNVFDVNVFGLLNVVQAVGSRMRARKTGSIVVVGSNAAGVPRMSMGAYGSSKSAATMLTRILGLELAGHGVRANIVAPGSTDTDMQRSLWANPTDDSNADSVVAGDLATFKAGIPLGRIASADDIADAVEFLLSDRARHITMQSLYVDGGATLRA